MFPLLSARKYLSLIVLLCAVHEEKQSVAFSGTMQIVTQHQ